MRIVLSEAFRNVYIDLLDMYGLSIHGKGRRGEGKGRMRWRAEKKKRAEKRREETEALQQVTLESFQRQRN